MDKAHTAILNCIRRRKPGDVIFTSDFSGLGTDAAIRKSLSRLAQNGLVKRLAHGVYYLPKFDPVLGEVYPSAEDVAQKIADKEKVHIYPAGAFALNKLGLSTQVPTNLVYITDGPPRLLSLGKMKVKFKSTTSKKLSMKGKLSKMIIIALEETSLDKLEPNKAERIKDLLLKENPRILKHDLALASRKVHDYIVKLLKGNP